MLPILRIIPVGGVLLAIAITVLALSPPDGSDSLGVEAPARGPLLDRESHPEWRHFLIQAALRRAEELERLRELPDTAAHRDPLPGIAASPSTDTGLAQDAPEPLAVEIPAGPAETGALQPAPLPAAPVLAVHSQQIPVLQPSDDAGSNLPGDISSVVAESAGTGTRIVRAALPVAPGSSNEPPAVVFSEAREEPGRQEISTAVEDATLPIEDDAVGSAAQAFAAPHAPDGDAALAASETIPPTKESDDVAGKVLALAEDVPVGDADVSIGDVKAPAESLARADAGHIEDRPDDAGGTREAALSVPLPRESTRRLVEPSQNRRAVGRRTRPAGTDVKQTDNPDFFEALLRIFSANARPPGGDTTATRRRRMPY